MSKNKKNKEEELEVIDLFEDEKEPVKKKVVKRKLKKGLLFQTIFVVLSAIFIIGCVIFYGLRFIKYYKLYNPKDENGKAVSLLSNYITSNSTFVYEGDGLYISNGNYIFKGEKVNNYINYSGFLWRIIKVNEDKTIDIILDKSINNLKWNSTISNFNDSDINKYLNKKFIENINKDYLVNTMICNDTINSPSEISCKEPDSTNLVRLLNIDEFINSKASEKTFISNNTDIWLSSKGSEKAWTINGDNVSYAETTNSYYIKPVVTLKSTTAILSGDGTKEKPYEIEKENKDIKVGDHIKIGEDTWTVYEIEKDNYRLTLSNLYKDGQKTYRFDLTTNKYNPENKSSLAEYLNNDFYNSLSYKDILQETVWNVGEYNDSYEDIYTEKIKAFVSIPSIVDLKLDDVTNYYVINGLKDNKSYLYADGLVEAKSKISRPIKPCISIKKSNIQTGNGSLKTPYELEG